MTIKELKKISSKLSKMSLKDIEGNFKVQYRTKFSNSKIKYIIMCNSHSIWVTDNSFKPPYHNVINWRNVEDILSKENDPEYFL